MKTITINGTEYNLDVEKAIELKILSPVNKRILFNDIPVGCIFRFGNSDASNSETFIFQKTKHATSQAFSGSATKITVAQGTLGCCFHDNSEVEVLDDGKWISER